MLNEGLAAASHQASETFPTPLARRGAAAAPPLPPAPGGSAQCSAPASPAPRRGAALTLQCAGDMAATGGRRGRAVLRNYPF